MQAVRRSMQYTTMGVHGHTADMMRVRDHVRLPDADAGRNREGEQRSVYVHNGPVPSSRRAPTVPWGVAVVILGILVLFFVIKIGVRLNQRALVSKQISEMEQAILRTTSENRNLEVDLAACRDSSRICYKAVQDLGMMSSAAVEAVPVIAPDTRPFEQSTISTAENSPSSAGHITGSR